MTSGKEEKLRALANSNTFYWTKYDDFEFDEIKRNSIAKLGYFDHKDRTEWTDLWMPPHLD